MTFGRAYEQYIAKTRSMATLSPGEMDEILRPLLNLSDDFHSSTSLMSNGNSKSLVNANGNGKNGLRLPTLASSEDCSETSSTSSSMSVCQLVSQIAIDHSSKVNNVPKVNGNGNAPVSYNCLARFIWEFKVCRINLVLIHLTQCAGDSGA